MTKHALWALVSLIGCVGTVEGEAPIVDHEVIPSALDVFDRTAVIDLDEETTAWLAEVERVNLEPAFERLAFFSGNAIAEEALSAAVNVQLAREGLDARVVIEASTPGRPRATSVWTSIALPSDAPAQGVACAYAEPPPPVVETSCRFVVARALESAFDLAILKVNEAPLPEDVLATVRDPDRLTERYRTAAEDGVLATSFDALDALKDAGVCDRVASPLADAFTLGEAIGANQVWAHAAQVRGQVPITECDYVGAIAAPARASALAEIDALVAGNALCPGFEPESAEAAARYAGATSRLRQGIAQGIERGYQQTVAFLAQDYVCTPPPPPTPEYLYYLSISSWMRATGGAVPTWYAGTSWFNVYHDVCIPNGCGGCYYISCMDSPEWRSSAGRSCPGTTLIRGEHVPNSYGAVTTEPVGNWSLYTGLSWFVAHVAE